MTKQQAIWRGGAILFASAISFCVAAESPPAIDLPFPVDVQAKPTEESISAAAAKSLTYHIGKLKRVTSLASGNLLLSFYVDPTACPNANSPKTLSIEVGVGGVTQEGVEAMADAAHSAAENGRPVLVWFENGTSSCSINQLTVLY